VLTIQGVIVISSAYFGLWGKTNTRQMDDLRIIMASTHHPNFVNRAFNAKL